MLDHANGALQRRHAKECPRPGGSVGLTASGLAAAEFAGGRVTAAPAALSGAGPGRVLVRPAR
jgi:hypothetical protein